MAEEKTLVLVGASDIGSSEVSLIVNLASAGARIIAWEHPTIVQDRFAGPDIAAKLAELGIEAQTPTQALGPNSDFDVEEAVISWFKAFGRASLSEGRSIREIFRHGPLVLWWWVELYLYHDTPFRLVVRDVEVLVRLINKFEPKDLVLVQPVRDLVVVARKLSTNVVVAGEAGRVQGSSRQTTWLFLTDVLKMWGTGFKSIFRARRRSASGECRRIFFLTHASMWKPKRNSVSGGPELSEVYFDRLIPEIQKQSKVSVVAFGPPVPFKQRDLSHLLEDRLELSEGKPPYRSIREYFSFPMAIRLTFSFARCFFLWRQFRRLTGLRQTLVHHDVSLLGALGCFRDSFLRQLPWAIRSYYEVDMVLRVEQPHAMVLYAESSGLGRAATAAARKRLIPSFAIQHGIMYPHYFSHEHSADEMVDEAAHGAVPIPNLTAVFGSLAQKILVERGHYPNDRIVITGNPKFDALVKTAEALDPARTRKANGIPDGVQVFVLATRFSAVSPVFQELVRAVDLFKDLWLLVKPHQAESSQPYLDAMADLRVDRVKVLSNSSNLLELLVACDALVTVDSLASSEALVLGRPILVVNLPNNLTPLVDRGVALGVRRHESVTKALATLLYDEKTLERLENKRMEYIQEFAYGADGQSTERMVQAIEELADEKRGEK